MSALECMADSRRIPSHVRFVPLGDIILDRTSGDRFSAKSLTHLFGYASANVLESANAEARTKTNRLARSAIQFGNHPTVVARLRRTKRLRFHFNLMVSSMFRGHLPDETSFAKSQSAA